MILDGKLVASTITNEVKRNVEELKKKNIIPSLAVIQVGEDAASKIYIRNKEKACLENGILFQHYQFCEKISEKELKDKIEELNQDSSVHGILIQSPLPKHLNENKIFQLVSPEKDVDGFTNTNIAKLVKKEDGLKPCTPSGILKLLKYYNLSLDGLHVVMIGRSLIVGKPMMLMALNEDATVTICHVKTKNLSRFTKTADVIICAVGIPNFLTSDMVSPNAIVIDVGINRVEGHIVGDVDFESVFKIASWITPVPKGIGPMTIATLLENVVTVAQKQLEKK